MAGLRNLCSGFFNDFSFGFGTVVLDFGDFVLRFGDFVIESSFELFAFLTVFLSFFLTELSRFESASAAFDHNLVECIVLLVVA